jgi:DNA-binding LacI/PurR family transcriptional regulator
MMTYTPIIREIAKMVDVSTMIVSPVLNNALRVRDNRQSAYLITGHLIKHGSGKFGIIVGIIHIEGG